MQSITIATAGVRFPSVWTHYNFILLLHSNCSRPQATRYLYSLTNGSDQADPQQYGQLLNFIHNELSPLASSKPRDSADTNCDQSEVNWDPDLVYSAGHRSWMNMYSCIWSTCKTNSVPETR